MILDERKARRLAMTLGLKVTGTLGLLLVAKQSGLLTSLRAAVATLRSHGIWLNDELAASVISLAGE